MFRTIAIVVALCVSIPALAQAPSPEMRTCLSDSTTGKDRKNLARWFISSIVIHPEMRDLARVTPETIESSSRAMGDLVTRLFTQDCSKQAQTLVREQGPQALGNSFEVLGQLAMMELLSNPDILASMNNYLRYVDQEKLFSVVQPK